MTYMDKKASLGFQVSQTTRWFGILTPCRILIWYMYMKCINRHIAKFVGYTEFLRTELLFKIIYSLEVALCRSILVKAPRLWENLLQLRALTLFCSLWRLTCFVFTQFWKQMNHESNTFALNIWLLPWKFKILYPNILTPGKRWPS